MKIVPLFLLFAAMLTIVAAQWSKDDHEIFDLQAALEKDHGEGATFYSIFNLSKGATAQEIRKAYRARSMELHPDKHGGDAAAAKRFERLGLINKILRDERRDRYDHFLKNGFPRWRGTGYFYARYRPGLGFTLFFLTAVTAAVHFLVLNLNYNRDKRRLVTLRNTAKVLAWGPRYRSIEAEISKGGELKLNKGVIIPAEKKVRLPLGGIDIPDPSPTSADEDEASYWDNDEKAIRKALSSKGNSVIDNGGSRKSIDALVIRDGAVFVLDPSNQEWMPLDDSATRKPTMASTWPFALVTQLLQFVKKGEKHEDNNGDDFNIEGTVSSQSSKKRKSKSKSKKKLQ